MSLRATPQEYFARQPTVQGIEEPIQIQQAPQPYYYMVQLQPDNSYKLILVAGVIIIGVIGIVAIAAFFSKST